MVKTYLIIATISLVFSCSRDAILSISKSDNNTQKIKLDGYYYVKEKGVNEGMISAFFLYKNGLVRYIGSDKTNDLKDIDNYVMTEFINSKPLKEVKLGWGLYQIIGNKISIEYWQGTFNHYNGTRTLSGEILNNLTLNITKISFSENRKINSTNDLYYFRPFSPKPDSTNNFIK